MIELMISDNAVTMTMGEFVMCISASLLVGALVGLLIAAMAVDNQR